MTCAIGKFTAVTGELSTRESGWEMLVQNSVKTLNCKMCTLNVEYITCSLCYCIDLFVDLQRLYVLEPQKKR